MDKKWSSSRCGRVELLTTYHSADLRSLIIGLAELLKRSLFFVPFDIYSYFICCCMCMNRCLNHSPNKLIVLYFFKLNDGYWANVSIITSQRQNHDHKNNLNFLNIFTVSNDTDVITQIIVTSAHIVLLKNIVFW